MDNDIKKPVEKPTTLRKWLTNIVLVSMLFLMPILSIYFLSKGLNFNRGIDADLGEYGTLPSFTLFDEKGKTVTNSQLNKNALVVHFSDMASPQSMGAMHYIYDQFKDNSKVKFITFSQKVDTLNTFSSFAKTKKIDSDKWMFLTDTTGRVEAMQKSNFIVPDSLLKIVKKLDNSLILIDTNMVIRNYYPVSDTMQLNRLIVTLSKHMPPIPKKEVIYKPEIEK